jgi:dTDP-4-dehydrorhamnose reductase
MIYLLGGTGYIGQAFQRYFKQQKIAYHLISRSRLDYTDPAVLESALRKDKPDFLINCAGYTGKPNVDACEIHKAECLFGNAVLPGRIAEACATAGIPWGHVSSGCIYTGSHPDGSGFSEEDPPNFSFRQNNCSFYSGTKALGEEVLAGLDGVYLWRLRIPFNNQPNPRNYLQKLMRYDRLLDATNSLSHLDEFVTAAFSCHTQRVDYGTYNLTNPGAITTREVVELIQASGVCSKSFDFFSDEREFMRLAANTPRSNCVLNTDKATQAGIRMSPVREAIQRALAEWNNSPNSLCTSS